MTPKVLYMCLHYLLLLVTGQQAHAESNHYQLRNLLTDEINYIFPGNKEKVFTETVDQFYRGIKEKELSSPSRVLQKTL